MPRREAIDWAKTAREWADEVAALEERGEDIHSREYRVAIQNLRVAERHVETENEKQAERDRYDDLTPQQVAREVVDRAMNGR
jgi:hypothetical protein